jgi:hypothetical protein
LNDAGRQSKVLANHVGPTEVGLTCSPHQAEVFDRASTGDVSRGKVVSINNYHRLFKDILTPVQLDGLRMLVTPFPKRSSNQPVTASAPNRAWV